ncbi:DUF2642 domain-containing protein [Priestia megaterium]|nr:DUF2642 domain-containing protein [Priestia megaterium]
MRRATQTRLLCCTTPTPPTPPTTPVPLRARLLTLINDRVAIETLTGSLTGVGLNLFTGILIAVLEDYVVLVDDELSMNFIRISQIEAVRGI